MQDKKKFIAETEQDFFKVSQLWELDTARKIAAHAVKLGYRKERETEWVLDTEFESAAKVRYRCRECGYWQVAKKQNAENMIRALHYCPNCGAHADKPEDKQ